MSNQYITCVPNVVLVAQWFSPHGPQWKQFPIKRSMLPDARKSRLPRAPVPPTLLHGYKTHTHTQTDRASLDSKTPQPHLTAPVSPAVSPAFTGAPGLVYANITWRALVYILLLPVCFQYFNLTPFPETHPKSQKAGHCKQCWKVTRNVYYWTQNIIKIQIKK